MRTSIIALAAGVALLAAPLTAAADFDHSHGEWDRLTHAHVRWIGGGVASRVDYRGFQKDRARLRAYLDGLSAVPVAAFDRWNRKQRLAFLINAYNAFTVELILTAYPDLDSIKDLGSLFKNPWKREFFTLLGQRRSLDDIEHGMIRAPGVYNEPRIHFAVVCAAIGCPGIRNEAFTAERLDAQLEDSLRRFLSDRSRNRYDAGANRLTVSKIFKWYADDFDAAYGSLGAFFARYAALLTADPGQQVRIRRQSPTIDYLDYDWRLNDLR